MADMGVNICGVAFKNPVIAASGTFGFGREYQNFYDVSLLGGISVKRLTRLKRQGNPPARVAETPSGMLNSVGLQNPGVEAFIADDLPWLKQQGTVIPLTWPARARTITFTWLIASVAQRCGWRVGDEHILAPTLREGGVAFGTRSGIHIQHSKTDQTCGQEGRRYRFRRPIVADIARAAGEAGADAISLINTLTGMAVDVYKKKPILANIVGRPVARQCARLRCAWYGRLARSMCP